MSLREAVRAWRSGDALNCIAACDALTAKSGSDPRAALLKARALTRLRRSTEALTVIGEALESRPESDQVRVLRATGLLQTDQHADGHADLVRLAGSRNSRVKAQANLALGLRYFELRQLSDAKSALDRVPLTSGVAYARALEGLGWIEKADGDGIAARRLFNDALTALDRSASRDRLLEANLVAIIGNFAIEALDADALGAVEHRFSSLCSRDPLPAWPAYWHSMNRSMAAELQGRVADALHHARAAARSAPSIAFNLLAQCRRAEVLHAYGELFGFRDLASEICEQLLLLDKPSLTQFEEINVVVVVAETLALLGEAARARAVLQSIADLSSEQLHLLTDEPAKRAYFTATRALVDDVSGDTLRALHGARKAFNEFRALGHTRRAVALALRIKTLMSEDEVRSYLETTISALPSESWMRAQLAEIVRIEGDSLLATLSRGEIDVLRLLCKGQSTAEIASARGRSAHTIRNTISALLRVFGVRTRAALVSECGRRGITVGASARDPRTSSTF